MLTGLKYRADFTPSQRRRYYWLAVGAVMTASVWSWKGQVLVAQQWWQLAVTALVWGWVWQNSRCPLVVKTLRFDESGLFFLPATEEYAELLSDSRVGPGVLWLHLGNKRSPDQRQWLSIYRDSTSDTAYRRLCRVVLRTSAGNHA